jgi:hypothetical protein
MLSTSSNCEGATVEGVLGHISAYPVVGTLPLYRLHGATDEHHLETITVAEIMPPEVLEGALGYAW